MPRTSTPETETISGKALLTRLAWMLFGNLALLACAAVIARDDLAPLSLLSGLFWAIVGGLIGLRYVDITRYAGQTSKGEPATLRDWKRYSVGLATASLAIWALAIVV